MREEIFIQIRFWENTEFGEYSDALYFPIDKIPSQKEIDEIKVEKIKQWIKVIEMDRLIPKPTIIQLDIALGDLERQKQYILDRKKELERK